MTPQEKLLGHHRLILASRSPRRRQLLTECGLPFTLAPDYDVEELFPDDLPAEQTASFLAALKSDAYPFPLVDGDVLVTADTVVICNGRVFGKPKNRAEAVEMLGALSGNRHTVVTGVCLRDDAHKRVFDVRTDVWFRKVDADEVEYYVDTFEPFDKAGAYAIQQWIGYVAVERIEGSFYNVMGLPVQRLYAELKDFCADSIGLV